MNNNFIEQLKNKLNISDFDNLSKEQYGKIMELIQNDNFSIEQLSQLVKLIPNIIDLQKDYLDSLKLIIDGVKTTQVHSLDSIHNSLESTMRLLEKITEKAQNEQTLRTIAEITKDLANLHLRIAEIIKENNETWQSLAKFAMAAISVVGVVLAIALKKEAEASFF